MQTSVPPGIDTVFFDAGNTLVGIDFIRLSAALDRIGISATPDALDRAEVQARLAVDRQEHIRATADRDRWGVYFRDMLSRVACLPEGAFERVRAAIEEAHRELNLWQRVMPGTAELLEALEKRGYRLGVISNSDGRVESILERTGLLIHFSAVFDSHLVGLEKPDPALFQLAARCLDVEPSQCLYVGDIYHVDVVGARAAGFFPVLVDPAGNHADKDCVRVRALPELADLLAPRPPRA